MILKVIYVFVLIVLLLGFYTSLLFKVSPSLRIKAILHIPCGACCCIDCPLSNAGFHCNLSSYYSCSWYCMLFLQLVYYIPCQFFDLFVLQDVVDMQQYFAVLQFTNSIYSYTCYIVNCMSVLNQMGVHTMFFNSEFLIQVTCRDISRFCYVFSFMFKLSYIHYDISRIDLFIQY